MIACFGGNNTVGPIDVATAVNAHGGPCGWMDFESETFVGHSLRADGFDASEDGTGRGTPRVPVAFNGKASASQSMNPDTIAPTLDIGKSDGVCVAFSCKDHGADAGDVSPTLRSMAHDGSHANAGGQAAIAIQERAVSENLENGPQDKGHQEGVAYTLEARNKVQSVATAMSVRRLLPVECERLQGFPDDYTLIKYRGKTAADGPRYKALGNSMAVPVMRWIGERIQAVEDLL